MPSPLPSALSDIGRLLLVRLRHPITVVVGVRKKGIEKRKEKRKERIKKRK
jgi:hypothetical protein